MPVPDFSPGEVLTASAMDSIGLWLVATATASGTSGTIQIDNCFSTTYTNYRFIYNLKNSITGQDLLFQFRTTTNYTSANYQYGVSGMYSNNTSNDVGIENSTSAQVGYVGTADSYRCAGSFDVLAPNVSNQHSGLVGQYMFFATKWGWRSGGLAMSVTDAFTGFRLFVNSGNLTGTVKVYGYRD